MRRKEHWLTNIRFLGFAVGLMLALYHLVTKVPEVEEHFVEPFTHMVAKMAALVLLSAGADVEAAGPFVFTEGFSVEIVPICTALEAMALFVAAVVAFPASVRRRILGLAGGLVAIHAINVLRIVVLFQVGVHYETVLNQAHFYYAQACLMIATAGVWVAWVAWVSRHESLGCHPVSI